MIRAIFIVSIFIILTGCGSIDRSGYTGYLHCRRVSELESLKHCKATVEKIHPCGVLLRTDDGQSLSLAGPMGGDPEVISFVRTLEAGRTYSLPRDFLKFQQHNKSSRNSLKAPPDRAPEG